MEHQTYARLLLLGDPSDYESWVPHWDSDVKDEKFKGCLLGLKETFRKLKKDSWYKSQYSFLFCIFYVRKVVQISISKQNAFKIQNTQYKNIHFIHFRCSNGNSYRYESNKVEDPCECTVDDYEW